MYHQEKEDNNFYSSNDYSSNEDGYNDTGGYGYNYRNNRLAAEVSLKGKIQQKYWRTKQKAIEKLGKEQDEFVISGDAEVDARLEAFQHMRMTCMQLMYAVDIYQNKIFALSQDENEMGRFLGEQGALDKTKAGKMMIAVGKAQSFAAQQRLGLRASLARLFSELETFRFRAIQDTQTTITKMEQARSDYRARLLWMADISKELDPEQMKRLDKFRDVQQQVKVGKQLFDKLKGDVIQKIDLLSASRCNLLSATLEPYQTAMITFLSSTSKSYNSVYQQFQGYPSFQFQVLKNIIPNNGIVDEDDEDENDKAAAAAAEEKNKSTELTQLKEIKKDGGDDNNVGDDDDDKLISFDMQDDDDDNVAQSDLIDTLAAGSKEGKDTGEVTGDLLGSLDGDLLSPDFGEYTCANEDLMPKHGDLMPQYGQQQQGVKGGAAMDECPSVDELLFGLSGGNEMENTAVPGFAHNDMDLLSDELNNHSLGINDRELNNSFSSQWQSMFGTSAADVNNEMSDASAMQCSGNILDEGENNESENENQNFMPSFLLDQLTNNAKPLSGDPTKSLPQIAKESSSSNNLKSSAISSLFNQSQQKLPDSGKKDMSKWLDLFAELDPLSNPDAVGSGEPVTEGKQAC